MRPKYDLTFFMMSEILSVLSGLNELDAALGDAYIAGTIRVEWGGERIGCAKYIDDSWVFFPDLVPDTDE